MKLYFIRIFTLTIIFVFLSQCTQTEELIIEHQVTGGIQTNCYLIYGEKSKEAALIDVGGIVDSLLLIIKEKDLNLKYVICTHGHFDHLIGVPAIKDLYPKAKIVIHEDDYKDIFTQKEWAEKNFGPGFIEWLKSDSERKKIYDFDVNLFGKPDIFIKHKQELDLGYLTLKVIHSPGHSPGSVCFYADSSLFSGDVLFYRTVGRTDVQNSSREDQIKSVRNLYQILPEYTKVFPGHGQFTDIGSEKRENKRIKENGGEWL